MRCIEAADATAPVHLELTRILTCPHCGPEHGLIAFVDRMEDRRIVAGRLDCPVCERRHTVREGTVFLGGDAPDDGEVPSGDAALEGLPEPATTAAALLGPPRGPEILLLAGGAEPLASTMADLRPHAAVVTCGRARSEKHPRVYPVVPSRAGSVGSHLPFRAGSFGGAVLTGGAPGLVSGVVPALEEGARLVVLAPRVGAAGVAARSLRELASDARAWVGVRA